MIPIVQKCLFLWDIYSKIQKTQILLATAKVFYYYIFHIAKVKIYKYN